MSPNGFGPPADSLPALTETKILLDGRRKQFACRVLRSAPGSLVVLFVSEQEYRVDDLTLPAGTVTFGHFWSGRPYNVYHWMDPAGRTLGHYFNLAGDTRIDADGLSWRDLVLDVLVPPGQPPRVLDEDELPASLTAELRAEIDRARAAALAEQPDCSAALEHAADELWPRLFGQPRAAEGPRS